MKFRVIVADPPWKFSDSLSMSDVKRSSEANYDVMTIADIRQLPIKKFAHPDGCVLALWVPGSLLQEGMDTMKDWGFQQKQVYVWVKTKKDPFKELTKYFVKNLTTLPKDSRIADLSPLGVIKHYIKAIGQFKLSTMLGFGMGRLFRQTHEICLIGTSDNEIYQKLKNKSQRSVCLAPNLRHSAKPDDLQASLELMFPRGKRLELFARRHRKGWVCLGNEICDGEDIRVSLAKLNNRQP